MLRIFLVLVLITAATTWIFLPSEVSGHNAFKKAFETEQTNLRVTCNACHYPTKPKTDRNEFGQLFFRQLEPQQLTERWQQLTGAERRQFEDEVMHQAFVEALKKVKEMEDAEGRKYGPLIESGQIEGTTLKD